MGVYPLLAGMELTNSRRLVRQLTATLPPSMMFPALCLKCMLQVSDSPIPLRPSNKLRKAYCKRSYFHLCKAL